VSKLAKNSMTYFMDSPLSSTALAFIKLICITSAVKNVCFVVQPFFNFLGLHPLLATTHTFYVFGLWLKLIE